MAIEITSDSIVKILVRRGTDSERQSTTLTEGEIGYCIDTQRVFVGDGISLGGNVVGNKFLGRVSDPNGYTSIAQNGDMVYRTAGLNVAETLYAFDGAQWRDVHPKPYQGSNGIFTLEKAPAGTWRLTEDFVGGSGYGSYPDSGLTLTYDGGSLESITGVYNRLDFDSRYVSLCSNFNSFYFGNINTKTVTNNLQATVNVNNSLFLNTHQSNPYQIKIFALDPNKAQTSTIESISGNFDIKGKNRTSLYVNNYEAIRMSTNGSNLVTTTLSSVPNTGSYGNPNFNIYGVPVFRDNVYFDADADVTILGNLSVYGDTTYLETTVTTTSALSVINRNLNQAAMIVAQLNSSGGSPNQAIARFYEGAYAEQNLLVKETQFTGINVPLTASYVNTGNHNFVVNGSTLIQDHPNAATFGNGKLDVRYSGAVAVSGSSISLIGNTVLQGTLDATGDITAYYVIPSDRRLKDNISNIDSALDKINNIRGVEFNWNDKSTRTGHDYGVIAQEVEEVLPSLVLDKPNGYKAVRYDSIIPILVEAVKELKKKIEEK